MSFSLKDITEEFLAKIVLFYFAPPCLWENISLIVLLSEDGVEYRIGGCHYREGFEYKVSDWHKVFPMYSLTGLYGSSASSQEVKQGWRLLGGGYARAVARADVADTIAAHPDFSESVGIAIVEIAAEALGFDYAKVHENQVVYDKTLEAQEQEKQDAINREKAKLKPEDVKWERLDDTVFDSGYRLRLAEKHHDGSISAHLYTIEEQRAYDPDVSRSYKELPVETYNLYLNTWRNVIDPIEIGHEGMELKERGEFRRSFLTLEKAKQFVLDRCSVNKENRLDEGKVFAPPTPRKLTLTPNESAGRYLPEARRLAKAISVCYYDSKRYLLQTEKLRKQLSEANICWLDAVWKEFNEAVAHVVRGDDPKGV